MQEKEEYELRMLMHSLSTIVENLQAAQEMDCVQSICQLHYPELAEHLWMAVRNANIRVNA